MDPANLTPEHIDVLRRIHVGSGERSDDDREHIAQLALDLKRAGFLRWHGSMLLGRYLITAKGLTRIEIVDAEVAAKDAAEHATATAERLAELRAQGEAVATALGLHDATATADAINHNPIAVQMHMRNHPGSRHFTCDIFEVDPRVATRGQPLVRANYCPAMVAPRRARRSVAVEARA